MRRMQKLFLLLLSSSVIGGGLYAQGSGSTAAPAGYNAPDPYAVTTTVTGTLRQLNDEGKTFLVVDEKTGRSWNFALGEKTKFKGNKKVLGKKQISWSDLQVGHRVKVKFHEFNKEVVEIKVLKPKKS
ncbi:MAG: hypothetical protein ACE5JX_12210 [Acidobacteriota bacterium]